jgi:hypothetical protein
MPTAPKKRAVAASRTRRKKPGDGLASPPKAEKPATQRAIFLETYRATGNVSESAKAAGIGRRTHYDWVESDEVYAAAVEDAKADAIEALELEARKRATRPNFPSDTLLIFLLKKLDPSYRDSHKVEHTGPGGGAIAVSIEFVKPADAQS